MLVVQKGTYLVGAMLRELKTKNLPKFLSKNYSLSWISEARIAKVDDSKTIRSTKYRKRNSLFIKNSIRKNVNLI